MSVRAALRIGEQQRGARRGRADQRRVHPPAQTAAIGRQQQGIKS
jgi:hypothetical protein